MSAQNLPIEIKHIIKEKINNYTFLERDLTSYPFYVSHMLEKDIWGEHGNTFLTYLDDIDSAREVDWKYAFKEMKLEKYDKR